MNNTKKIALIGILAAVNIASRVIIPLPNIKPVTSIIIITSICFGFLYGASLSVVTTLVSNLLLGLGPWTIFQTLAWVTISFLGYFVGNVLKIKNIVILSVFSGLMGYLFGFIVSFEKLFTMGFYGFIAYYLQGLLFDTMHAVGNVVFYFICSPILLTVFNKYFNNHLYRN